MKKLLFVDDDQDLIANLDEIFTRKGYDVKVANDGQTGLLTIDIFKPEVVFLDIELPDMTGYNICTIIKEKYKGICVIFLSGLSLTLITFHPAFDNLLVFSKSLSNLSLCQYDPSNSTTTL